jgi:hypothetical protein
MGLVMVAGGVGMCLKFEFFCFSQLLTFQDLLSKTCVHSVNCLKIHDFLSHRKRARQASKSSDGCSGLRTVHIH